MEKERRESFRFVLTGFSPAVIEAPHGITARRDDDSVQEVVFSFTGQLQEALGEATYEGAKIGIADIHFLGSDPPQAIGEDAGGGEDLVGDIGTGIADNAAAFGFPVLDVAIK
jgi:hypothetical protein